MTRYERAAQIWAVLALAARNRQVLTYDLVGRAIGVPRTGLANLLGPIQDYCLANQLPPLTALVVSEHTGLPGIGFIAAQEIPAAQAQVFRHDWLAADTPTTEALQATHRPGQAETH